MKLPKQESLENLDEIAIYPAVEWNLVSFAQRKMLLFLDEPNILENGLGVDGGSVAL